MSVALCCPLPLADAFVAVWLPGSEGQGIADVLVGTPEGEPRHDFTGKLSFTWPQACAPDSAGLFAFGEGWSYAEAPSARDFSTDCALLDADRAGQLRLYGRGLNAQVSAEVDGSELPNLVGAGNGLAVTAFDYQAQDDARRLAWTGQAALTFRLPEGFAVDPNGSLVLTYSLNTVPSGPVALTGGESLDLTSTFTLGAGKGWRTARIPLACLGEGGWSELALRAGAGFTLEIAQVVMNPESFADSCEGPF